MGRVIAEKVKGINWKAKISLILIFTMLFSTFMYQGWFKPRGTQAATAAYQAVGTYQSGTGALTVPWPTHQAGDVALLFVETPNVATTLTTPAGFVAVTNSPQSTGTANAAGGTRLSVYWCRATSSVMASPVLQAVANHQIAVIVTFRGLTPTGNPFETSAGSVKATASTTTTFPTVTTTTANDLIVLAAALDRDLASTANASAWTNANLTGITERYDRTISTGVGGGLIIATGAKATAGATNTSTVTVSSTISTQMTIALQPDIVAPTVSSVAVQSGTTVDVTFSEGMNATGLTTATNYTISGTGKGTLATNPNSVALVSGNTYRLTWSSGEMLNGGDITITAANVQDWAGNTIGSPNSGTHAGGAVGVSPTVTINQAGGQADPTGISPINFTVVFSESTTNFATGDVAITGTAGGTKSATVTGSGTTYNVAVSGMTTDGTVVASINAGVATDAAGNGNLASTSTDNTVTWAPNVAPTVTVFTAPTTSTTKDIPVSMTATDSDGTVAGYMITTSATPPGAGDLGWSGTAPTTYTVAIDNSYTLYPWAKDNDGAVSAVYGTPKTVLVDTTPPTGLAASSPADEAIDQPLTTSITSTTATDSGSGSVQYYFDVVDTGTYTANSGWISVTSFAPPGLQNGTTYTWKVKAKDAAGNETVWSTPRSFTTVGQCFRNDPALDYVGSPISTVTTDGGTANYTMKVTNNDIGGCTNTTFTLSTTEVQDEGDNFVPPTLNSYSVTLAPGASANVTLGVTARTGKTAGREKATVSSAADAYHTAVTSATATTNLNVATCTANTPQLVIGPDAGNVAVGGTLAYSVSIKNTDVGAACTAVNYSVAIVSENPATPNADFNQSALTYQAQNGSTVNVSLNPGQTGTVTLTVSAKTPSILGVQNVTTIGATASLHNPPANVTATTTVGNSLLHNSINIQSTKWSSVGGWGVPGGKYGEFICNTCHTLDGTTNNIKKVRESITTPDTSKGALPGDGQPIVFTKVSGNAGDSGVLGDDSGLLVTSPRTSSNKICEICHTYSAAGTDGVRVHAYNSAAYTLDTDGVTPTSSNHKNFNAKDCIACHTHKAGFLPAGCDGCHGEPPTDVTLANVSGQTTGSVTGGKHTTHVTTLGFVCNNCHNGYTMPEDSTVNPGYYNISIGFSNFGSTTGTYSGQSNVSYSLNGGAQFLGNGTATCSTVYCHSNVQNDGGATGTTYDSPQWTAASVTCDSCHGQGNHTNGQPATGSHELHVTTGALACSVCHNNAGSGTASHSNRMIDMSINPTYGASAAYGTGSHAPGSTYAACSSVSCHGTSSPTWGANTTNDTCTKCHGTGTATITAATRYLVAPPKNTAGDSGNAADTGQVSDDPKVGAHQTHLQMLNGLSAFGTVDSRCQACHGTLPTSGTHANGSSEPVFEGLATKSGTMSPSYSSGSCNNTYCHNPAATGGTLNSANAGTGVSPSWTNAAYIADGTLKTIANCGVCHKSPWDAGFTSTFAHGVMTTSTDCSGCHEHNGGTGGSAGRQHMDGIKFGAGSCNSCHGYEELTWAASTPRAVEGKGAHAKHIAHLVTRWGGSLNAGGDQFGSGASWTNVCGVCHNGATHNMSEAIGGTGRTISILSTYSFGSSPVYGGVVGNSSSVNPKTCSNVSCHFRTTPTWSSY